MKVNRRSTGFKDMNGVMIYIGDIIKRGNCQGEVFLDGYGRLQPFDYLQPCASVDFEIIGHIQDNPELLKEVETK